MEAVSYAHSAKQAKRIKRFIENPDSNSGVLTQPMVIEAGDTVTIKSGRQAILADTVVNGDLVIEAGAGLFVPAGAGFNDLESQIALKANITDVNTAGIELKTIATGTATFTTTTNNINLIGIGIGVEIGDVIQISGAEDTKNNSEFTVEVITDDDNIIVNQAHANKGTSKNVATRASDVGVTVKLLAKWYNASVGIGQDWVMASRIADTVYYNNTNRKIEVAIYGITSEANRQITIKINNALLISNISGDIAYGGVYGSIPSNSNYSLRTAGTGTFTVGSWAELR